MLNETIRKSHTFLVCLELDPYSRIGSPLENFVRTIGSPNPQMMFEVNYLEAMQFLS